MNATQHPHTGSSVPQEMWKCGDCHTNTHNYSDVCLLCRYLQISTHIYTEISTRNVETLTLTTRHLSEGFVCRAPDWSRVHFRFQPSRCQDNIHFHQQHFNWRIRDPNCPFQFKLLLICWFRVGGCCSSFGEMKKNWVVATHKEWKVLTDSSFFMTRHFCMTTICTFLCKAATGVMCHSVIAVIAATGIGNIIST